MKDLQISSCFWQRIETTRGKRPLVDIFRDLCGRFCLEHISYVGLNLPAANGSPVVFSTYPAEWQARYLAQDYWKIDPVAAPALAGVLPFDWDQAPRDTPAIRAFFGEAGDFGVAEHGLSIPVQGTLGDTALLTVNANLSSASWRQFKAAMMGDLTYLGFLLHEHVLSTIRAECAAATPRLSPREIEVIRWAAEGKTAWETGRIINISERTVNFYFHNAAEKLGAASKAHTLAKAFRANLLR